MPSAIVSQSCPDGSPNPPRSDRMARMRNAGLESFFQPGPVGDHMYSNVRDYPHLAEARRFVEDLWPEYKHLADMHFLADARNHFLQRFWEMYLGVALVRRGFNLRKAGEAGPEFYFQSERGRVWIEAVAPQPGVGPDAVLQPQLGEVSSVPQERVLLRLTHALSEKLKKYNEAFNKGILKAWECYIVALNSRAIPHASHGSVLPYYLMAYLPIGHPELRIDKQSQRVVDSYFQYRSHVTKRNDEPVCTEAFLRPEYVGISGVLHSSAYATEGSLEMGGDFTFLHNPLATSPLSTSTFPFWRQYLFRDYALQTLEPKPSVGA